ncbi:hypothetical protein STPH1_7287 [Streptomyces sp. OM5714]|nr:hypothetical protein STPH1_7287 [Streptomyces sp. OM5714]
MTGSKWEKDPESLDTLSRRELLGAELRAAIREAEETGPFGERKDPLANLPSKKERYLGDELRNDILREGEKDAVEISTRARESSGHIKAKVSDVPWMMHGEKQEQLRSGLGSVAFTRAVAQSTPPGTAAAIRSAQDGKSKAPSRHLADRLSDSETATKRTSPSR